MTEFEYKNNSSWTSSPIMVTDCLGKFFTEINISRQFVWENHSSGIETPDKATVCLEKSHWTYDWKTKKR